MQDEVSGETQGSSTSNAMINIAKSKQRTLTLPPSDIIESYGIWYIMVTIEVQELRCDHEEADTRLLLHTKHAASYEDTDTVIIRSPDTDVIILTISIIHCLQANLYQHITGRNGRILHVNRIADGLGEKAAQALVGIHVFSGCDTVSAFRGKSKKKLVKIMLSEESHIATFHQLGMEWEITDQLLQRIERFVCQVYDQNQGNNINDARYSCFRLGMNDNSLPPNKDSLVQHTKRANCQASVHRRCLLQTVDAPNPHGHGWLCSDTTLTIQWMTLPPAPDSVMKLIKCKCQKSSCETSRCSCKSASLLCTELCECVSCGNKAEAEDDKIAATSSDESDTE
ncbi:uncharacterized protein [Ptychodera flava]|uniref:uncharacterized protein n=1 Tax=Ptychodera flava TaxID=63121 RepID=UPI00396A4657